MKFGIKYLVISILIFITFCFCSCLRKGESSLKNTQIEFESNFDADRYISEAEFNVSKHKQMNMTPQTLEQLRTHGVTENTELKLEYFFYTNSQEKAKRLADSLHKLNYTVKYGESIGTLVAITGWTSKMKMSNSNVEEWTKEMCDLGFKYDCEFDGWGTNPSQ